MCAMKAGGRRKRKHARVLLEIKQIGIKESKWQLVKLLWKKVAMILVRVYATNLASTYAKSKPDL